MNSLILIFLIAESRETEKLIRVYIAGGAIRFSKYKGYVQFVCVHNIRVVNIFREIGGIHAVLNFRCSTFWA